MNEELNVLLLTAAKKH